MTLSAEAESAIRRIYSIDPQSNSYQEAAIITVTSVSEGYADNLISKHVNAAKQAFTQFELMLLREVSDTFYTNWENRLKWICRGFGLADAGSHAVQQFQVVVELRNAIVHGNGSLAAYQTKSLPRQLALERNLRDHLAVATEAHRYFLTERTVSLAQAITTDLIRLLDAADR